MLRRWPTRSASSCSRTATTRRRSPTSRSTAALDRIQAAVDSGQIRRFTGNDYAQPLANGDLAACIAWSGDVIQLLADNPKLKWAIPKDGGMIWTDNMLIPTGGSVPTASTYMNYVYDPEIAAQIAAYVNYVTPVKGAKEELAKTDPEPRTHADLPDDETLSQVHQYDSAASRQRRAHHEVAEGLRAVVGRREWARSSTGTRALRPTSCSRPGSLWLAVFFLIPLGFLGYQSLQSGVFPNFEFTWEFSNFSEAISDYHEQLVRSFVYAGIATVACLVSRTRSSTGSRSGRGRGGTSSCSSSSRRSSSRTSSARSRG